MTRNAYDFFRMFLYMFQASDVWNLEAVAWRIDRSPAHHGRIRDDRHVRLYAQRMREWVPSRSHPRKITGLLGEALMFTFQIRVSCGTSVGKDGDLPNLSKPWNMEQKAAENSGLSPTNGLVYWWTGCHLRTVGDVDDCHPSPGWRQDEVFGPVWRWFIHIDIFIPAIPSIIEMVQKVGLYYSRFAETFHIVPWFSGRPLLFWDFYDFLTWISIWCTPDCS